MKRRRFVRTGAFASAGAVLGLGCGDDSSVDDGGMPIDGAFGPGDSLGSDGGLTIDSGGPEDGGQEADAEGVDARPREPTTSFWRPDDYSYPAAPAANGTTVFRVTNRSELDAALGNDRTIVLADGNYQAGARLNLDSLSNVTIMAENNCGAQFDWGAFRSNNNGWHVTRCRDITVRGLCFSYSQYYAIRFGGNLTNYGSPAGANFNVLVEFCAFSNTGAGVLKIDNGDTSANGETTGVEIRYCTFDNVGRSPDPGLESFCEVIYMGSGDSHVKTNRVNDINIHHNIIDGSGTPASSAGEAIEAKVYCSDIRIADNLITDWHTGQSTSGGAIAISINTGSNIAGTAPTAGTRGMESYLIENNRIYNASTVASWGAGNAVVIGHGNCTIRNNIIWGSQHAAIRFMQKNVASNGVFSNPDELDVHIYHNSFFGNGSDYSVDFQSPPNNARVRARNNASSRAADYPSNGVDWLSQDDAHAVSASDLVEGGFSGPADSGGGVGSGLRPISDEVLVTEVDVEVATDIFGNVRPRGRRQYGAAEG